MNRLTTILILFSLLFSDRTLTQSLQNDVAFVSLPQNFKGHEKGLAFKEFSFAEIQNLLHKKIAGKTVLEYSAQGRPVEAFYFPGTSDKKALIVGGVHGSELSSVEVAKKIIELLSNGETPYYNVIIIPSLFPDNAVMAMNVPKVGATNKGRYTTTFSADPNRQMPSLGKAFDEETPLDHHQRAIENENRLLLQLIQEYDPSRIVNLHAIKDVTKGGIYADPRTDCNGLALGFESDSSLAVSMARFIDENGGKVPGNNLAKIPTALYCHDPQIAPAGFMQKRNLHGSPLPGNRGYGVSLGGWATTAVCDEKYNRDAIRLITVEFPGYKASADYLVKEEKERCSLNVRLYAEAVSKVFLGEVEVEDL